MLRLPLAPGLARPSLRSSLAFVSVSCQSPRGPRRWTHPLDRRDHFQYAPSGTDLVHAEHGSPRLGGQCRRCQGALKAFGQPHTQSFPDEILVAESHQDGPSSVNKVFYVAQQTKTMVSVLTKIVGRIDQYGVPRDTRSNGAFGRGSDFGDHVVDHAALRYPVIHPKRPGPRRRATRV